MLPSAAHGATCAGAAVQGRTRRLGTAWYLCTFPLPTSLPIPLGIASPSGLALVTWAFSRLTPDDAGPAGLLIVAPRDAAGRAALEAGTRLVVATHFRDMPVLCGAAEAEATIRPDDLDAVAKAVVSAVMPETAPVLATLFPLLARSVAALTAPAGVPEVTMDLQGPHACTLWGTEIPNHLLVASGTDVACARVREARMRFAPETAVVLDLEPLWGPDSAYSADRAVLVGANRFTVANRRAQAPR